MVAGTADSDCESNVLSFLVAPENRCENYRCWLIYWEEALDSGQIVAAVDKNAT